MKPRALSQPPWILLPRARATRPNRTRSGGFGRPYLIDVGALHQECHTHVGPVLVEVLAAEAGADDVDRADVAQLLLGALERLAGGVVGGLLRASDELDDLDYGHLS